MDAEKLAHISEALYDLPKVQEYIQFYDLKVTLPPADINEFDLTKKGEEIPEDEDDYGDESGTATST